MTLALNSPGSVSSAGIVCSSQRLNNKTRLQGECQRRYGKQRRICANSQRIILRMSGALTTIWQVTDTLVAGSGLSVKASRFSFRNLLKKQAAGAFGSCREIWHSGCEARRRGTS
jgi:hypothetical protein